MELPNISLIQITGFVVAFIISVSLVPLVRKMCLKEGFYDIPDERKIHKKPIPRLGGIAIFLGTLFSLITVIIIQGEYPFGNSISAILAGGTIMFLMGIVDDTYGLNAKFKLFIQICCALIAYLLGVQILYANFPFIGHVYFGVLGLPLTIIWIVGISNAMNFIDGVDGLAGTVGVIGAVTLGTVALFVTPEQSTSTLISFILAGALAGFLVFNYNPAKIFMGDSGSLFMGFLLAALAIVGVMKSIAFTIFLPVFILAVPLFDICFATLRRLMKGKSPFTPDAEHLHHKLLKAGLTPNRTVFVFMLLTVSAGIIATSMVGALHLYLTIIVLICLLLFILSIISKYTRR